VKKVLFACGGTGGHIYPAVALAKELKSRETEIEVFFGGRKSGMESEKIPGLFTFFGIDAYPLKRGKIVENLKLPLRLYKSISDAKMILKQQGIDCVIATGGYVTLPFLLAAKWLKIPYYLQEQNVYAGITNKIAGKWAKAVFVPNEDCVKWFPQTECLVSGNPVRQINEEELIKPKEYNGFDKVVLILGGSQGARGVNQKVDQWIEQKNEKTLVYWQSGALEYQKYYDKYVERNDVQVVNFIEGIYSYMKFSDVVVSRAGASTIAELNVLGKGALFIPYPYAAENHQEENARSLERSGAALVELESNKNFDVLLNQLLESESMSKNLDAHSLELAKPNASKYIIDVISEKEGF
jgi:UDP-N-acetylglucosamine--N-acetylmuramyl-(pentapeptide) pyrophosphoryl-undecaprenol N-acetylglucosamine transferase